jgi:CheY-like chemotaxis protein
MPRMNGWDLLEAINVRSYAEHVSAIIVSSSIDTNDRKKAKTYKQVIGYLEKPIQAKDLRDITFSNVYG